MKVIGLDVCSWTLLAVGLVTLGCNQKPSSSEASLAAAPVPANGTPCVRNSCFNAPAASDFSSIGVDCDDAIKVCGDLGGTTYNVRNCTTEGVKKVVMNGICVDKVEARGFPVKDMTCSGSGPAASCLGSRLNYCMNKHPKDLVGFNKCWQITNACDGGVVDGWSCGTLCPGPEGGYISDKTEVDANLDFGADVARCGECIAGNIYGDKDSCLSQHSVNVGRFVDCLRSHGGRNCGLERCAAQCHDTEGSYEFSFVGNASTAGGNNPGCNGVEWRVLNKPDNDNCDNFCSATDGNYGGSKYAPGALVTCVPPGNPDLKLDCVHFRSDVACTALFCTDRAHSWCFYHVSPTLACDNPVPGQCVN